MRYEQQITNWIHKLSNGDERAVEVVFSKYFDRLIRLAAGKMKGMNAVPRDGEDIAISAIKSLCNGLNENRLELTSEDDLWACLFKITTRKVCAERRRAYAKKRGENQWLVSGDTAATEDDDALFNAVAGKEPSPELALQMAEAADDMLALFDKDSIQQQIIQLKLQGLTNQEIADQTGLVIRTVFWHLKNIQTRWMFYKSMEYLVENKFSGLSNEKLAHALGCKEEILPVLLAKMLQCWEKDMDPADIRGQSDLKLLSLRLLEPQKYFELFEQKPEPIRDLETRLPHIADSWLAQIKRTWKEPLQKIWRETEK